MYKETLVGDMSHRRISSVLGVECHRVEIHPSVPYINQFVTNNFGWFIRIMHSLSGDPATNVSGSH